MGGRNINEDPFYLRRNYWSSDDDESGFVELPRVYMGLSAEDIPAITGGGTPHPEHAEVRRREVQSAPGRREPAVTVRRDLPAPGRRDQASAAAARRELNAARRAQMQQDRDFFWQIINNTTPRSSILAPRSQRPVVGIAPTRSTPSLSARPSVRVSERTTEFRASDHDLLLHEQRYKKHRRDQQLGSPSNAYYSWFRAQDSRTPNLSAHSSPTHGSGFLHLTSSGHAEPVAGHSEPTAGPSQPIAGPSEPIAGPSVPIAGPSEPIAGPSRLIVPDVQRPESNADEPPISELTMEALQEEYTRWLNRPFNVERKVPNKNEISSQISGQTRASRHRPYQNINQGPSQNITLGTPQARPQTMSDEHVDGRHEIGEMVMNEPRDLPGDGEGENAEASSHAARLTLDEVVVEAPEDINHPDTVPGADGDQPSSEEQAAALPSETTETADPAPAAAADTNASNALQRPTNLPIKSESPQPGTSNPVGGKRKRDSTDDRSRPDTVAEFNMIMLRHLECPVCLDWMEPPIAQCRRGHVVCPRCRSKLNVCPVCRTPFSSVRNRAMEGVAEMLRYPCRYSCGREVGMCRRAAHEASCALRRYHCPAHACDHARTAMPRDELAAHFQCKHTSIMRTGMRHKFLLVVRSELHKSFIILAQDQYFHLNIDIDIHTWGAILHVSYIGPKKLCKYFVYEITVKGTGACRKLVYSRNTHSDLDKLSLSRPNQDRFHLTAEQALNYIRSDKNNIDKYMVFNLQISKLKDFDEIDEDSD